MSDWITDFYADVDAMRVEPFLDHFSDDGVVIFGNNPPAVGKEAIGEAIGGLWSVISGLRHEKRNLWFVDDDTAVFEVVTHYTTLGGAVVSTPCVSILEKDAQGKVRSLRIHIDLAPLFALFAQVGAEAGAAAPA